MIPKLQVPPLAASVIVPVPDWPLDGKLQVLEVGAAKEKFARFAPRILCAVIVTDEADVLMTATLVVGDVVPRKVDSAIGLGLKMIVPGLIVKLNANAGLGPPPGNGFVIVPATGMAWPGAKERRDRLRESIHLINKLWTCLLYTSPSPRD